MTDAELLERYPGFTLAQIKAGLTVPVCEGAEPFDWQAAMDKAFAFDSLAVAATEYVAAEVRVEPFWRALIVMTCAFVTAFGFCALAAFGQTPAVSQEWAGPTTLVVSAGGKQLMIFHADGRIETTADARPDEVAKAVIDAMRPYFVSLVCPNDTAKPAR